MLRNQDLNLLPIFDALVRERQLSRAAEALSMSQPAVSNALKRLRLSFKDDLFVRTRQGLVPTERALELHALIGPALNLVQRSFESELFDPLTSDRVINISMNTTMETLFLADFIKPLRQAAPQLRFRFFPDYLPEIPARLKDGRLNYAVEYIPLPEDKFDSVVLSTDKLTVICAKTHPTLKEKISLQQYQSMPHVSVSPRTYSDPGDSSRDLTPVERILGANLPRRNVAMHVGSVLSIPSIVAATDLIATVGLTV